AGRPGPLRIDVAMGNKSLPVLASSSRRRPIGPARLHSYGADVTESSRTGSERSGEMAGMGSMRGRRFFAKVAVTGLLLSGLGIVAASQAMASGTYQVVGTGGASLNVRSCANTSCGVIKTLAAGSWHFIACQVEGQYVTAP